MTIITSCDITFPMGFWARRKCHYYSIIIVPPLSLLSLRYNTPSSSSINRVLLRLHLRAYGMKVWRLCTRFLRVFDLSGRTCKVRNGGVEYVSFFLFLFYVCLSSFICYSPFYRFFIFFLVFLISTVRFLLCFI